MGRGPQDTPGTGPSKRVAASLPVVLAGVLLVAAALRFGAARADSPLEALGSRFLPEADGRPTLLYVFHERDCPTFEVLFEDWAELDRSGTVRAVAVGLGFPRAPDLRQTLLDTSSVELPVDFDLARAAERTMLGLGYRSTPVVLLLDGRGRVRLSLPAMSEPEARRRAVETIREQARHLSRASPGGVADPAGVAD